MQIIVGLGNPGSQYAMNRHNIGFMCVDLFLKSLSKSSPAWKQEHKALTQKIKISRGSTEKEILLVKPQTYMNKSGESVVSVMNFFKIQQDQLLVVQDDIDQNFGAMKFQHSRGHGGQNGVKNISELLGNNEYYRLKLGVGRPAHPGFDIGDYVLGNFPKEDLDLLSVFLNKSADALESFIFDGPAKAATKYNGQLQQSTIL
jgi:peptidyl-tRNA hydrolase, PTH1 family